MNARRQLTAGLALVLLSVALLIPGSAQAAFGLKSFSATMTNADESADFLAGSHPHKYTVNFEMNQNAEGEPEGALRDLIAELPPGLLGNPQALPHCTGAEFEGEFGNCPGDSQVGVARIKLFNGAEKLEAVVPVYNLVPPLGTAAAIGFNINAALSVQQASLRSGSDYGVSVANLTIPTGIYIQSVRQELWGVPADPSHDPERECINSEGAFVHGCPSDVKPAPFLTLPTSCGEPLQTTIRVDSLQNPGVFDSKTYTSEEGGEPAGMEGCNQLEFKPQISAQPTTNLADSPSGLDFVLHQPQNEDPEGRSTAHLKDATVTLPEGMTINPSVANGLAACSQAEIGYAPSKGQIHFTEAPQSCPDAAKIGTLEVRSPPVDHKLGGSVYVAKPYQNPFGTLMAIYLVVEDEQTGIIAKLAGKVTPGPQSGQLTTTFTESPQLPLEDVELHIFGGPRAVLKTPLTCGSHTTTSTLVPWSTPEGVDAHPSDSFVTSLPAGGSGTCPQSAAAAPNQPSFSAGTIAPQAATYSPFVLRIARPDGSQRFKSIETTLPKGLAGKLAGVPFCSEAQIAVARSREAPNQGAVEQASPSCPAASELGTVTVGAGASVIPFYVTGHAYLAGPYKGAPLSLLFITPAVAGPFDLGAVVIRTALHVDPVTAQIHAVADPIPTIIQGVPLEVGSILVNLNRPDFTLNPTSCDPTAVLGTAVSTLGQSAPLSAPFQVGGCRALPFKPRLSLRLKGGTRRADHPKLIATVRAKPGEANIASAQVKLPPSAFLDQAHLSTICTRVQFAADACPKGSIYGRASARTPLLDQPLSGNVYLRSSDHKLPDLVVALKGPDSLPIEVDLAGRTDAIKGALRNTFEAIPDAPVSSFRLELFGGKRGLIVNSRSLCAKRYRATVKLDAQSGKIHDSTPQVQNDCKRHHRKRGQR